MASCSSVVLQLRVAPARRRRCGGERDRAPRAWSGIVALHGPQGHLVFFLLSRNSVFFVSPPFEISGVVAVRNHSREAAGVEEALFAVSSSTHFRSNSSKLQLPSSPVFLRVFSLLG
jgi:hypothetical protein